MEAWAYQILQFGKFGSLLLSWGVLFGSAVVGLAFTGHAFKLGRAAYFLTMGLSFLFTGMTSLFVLGLHDAVKNDYLTVIVALIIGSLIPIGIFTGICAAARSRDAFAHGTDGSCPSSRSRTWCCCSRRHRNSGSQAPCALQEASCWSFWVSA